MFELTLPATPDLSYPLGSRALLVGRAPGVDLLLVDDAVSGRHAAIWTDGEHVYVQDLRSRNGVRLNDEPVVGTAVARAGDRVHIGRTELLVRVRDGAPMESSGSLELEDLASGVGVAFAGDRLTLGDSAGADVRVGGAPEVVLLRVGADEVLIGRDDDTRPLRVGEPFGVGGRNFVLRWATGAWRPTQDLGGPAGYLLEATLEAGPGPRAVLTDRGSGRQHVVEAENRATLLWILGRRRAEELAAARPDTGLGPDTAGWVSEAEVLTSLWGRAVGGSPANLRVLVCRIRKDVREAGLDPWFLEQRAGRLRAKVAEVSLR